MSKHLITRSVLFVLLMFALTSCNITVGTTGSEEPSTGDEGWGIEIGKGEQVNSNSEGQPSSHGTSPSEAPYTEQVDSGDPSSPGEEFSLGESLQRIGIGGSDDNSNSGEGIEEAPGQEPMISDAPSDKAGQTPPSPSDFGTPYWGSGKWWAQGPDGTYMWSGTEWLTPEESVNQIMVEGMTRNAALKKLYDAEERAREKEQEYLDEQAEEKRLEEKYLDEQAEEKRLEEKRFEEQRLEEQLQEEAHQQDELDQQLADEAAQEDALNQQLADQDAQENAMEQQALDDAAQDED